MPQELRVLQCIQCETFQVDIVKKSNKWQCKMCNAKQSLRKVLFHGTGLECRRKVQQLTQEKANKIEEKADAILDLLADETDENDLLVAASQFDENAGTWQGSNQNTANERVTVQKRKQTTEENGVQRESKTNKWDIFL